MNNTQITTKSAPVRKFFSALRQDRRGAELVEVLIALAIVALGGITAMNAIRDNVNTKGGDVAKAIGGIQVGGAAPAP